MGNAMRMAEPNSCLGTAVVPRKFTEAEIREDFSATIYQFSRHQLSKAAGCTSEATRKWLDGSRAPNLANTLNAARALPIVQSWLIHRAGAGDRAAQSGSADAVLRIVRQIAMGEGQDGAMCRAILRQAAAESV